jgi:copper transport protein
MSRLRRSAARIGIGLIAGTAAVVLMPGTAFAHAELERTNPAANAVLPDAPKLVDLHFSESVEVAFGSIQVLDASGHRADLGDPFHPGGRGSVVDVRLRPGMHDGTYLVSWRVVSDDSHPVAGEFFFSVGAPGAAPSASVTGGNTAVGLLLGVARFAGFAGLALLLGTSVFLLLCWPAGWRDRRAHRLLAGGWGLSLGATVTALLLQGPYGAGRGLSSLMHGSVLQSTLTTRFGHAHVLRLWLLLAFAGVVVAQVQRASGRDRRKVASTRVGSLAAVAIGVALLATVAFAGHADDGTERALALPIDVLHLTAMSAWLGGLATIVYCLLLRPGVPGELRTVMPRFSSLAADAVLVLMATGAFAAWRDLGSWGAITGTRQGLLLLLKLSVLGALLLAAAASRRWLRSRRGDGDEGDSWQDVRSLRVSIGAEAALATALLAVTAVLVAAPPGKTEYHRPSTNNAHQGVVTTSR